MICSDFHIRVCERSIILRHKLQFLRILPGNLSKCYKDRSTRKPKLKLFSLVVIAPKKSSFLPSNAARLLNNQTEWQTNDEDSDKKWKRRRRSISESGSVARRAPTPPQHFGELEKHKGFLTLANSFKIHVMQHKLTWKLKLYWSVH